MGKREDERQKLIDHGVALVENHYVGDYSAYVDKKAIRRVLGILNEGGKVKKKDTIKIRYGWSQIAELRDRTKRIDAAEGNLRQRTVSLLKEIHGVGESYKQDEVVGGNIAWALNHLEGSYGEIEQGLYFGPKDLRKPLQLLRILCHCHIDLGDLEERTEDFKKRLDI